MSYNISTWTTKELRDLRIPLAALESARGLRPPQLNTKTGELLFIGLSEGFELRGRQDGDMLIVEHIGHWGVGSGHTFDDLEKILRQSTGYLRAVLVWEDGDDITRLVVQDGTVTNEQIDLD